MIRSLCNRAIALVSCSPIYSACGAGAFIGEGRKMTTQDIDPNAPGYDRRVSFNVGAEPPHGNIKWDIILANKVYFVPKGNGYLNAKEV